MGKYFFILSFIIGIYSCKSKGNESNKSSDTLTVRHEEHLGNGGLLQLNNHAKWKTDSVTIVNVGLLKKDISEFLNNEPKDYSTVALQLQKDLNKLIGECKMSGPDHDALHQWLEPLLEKVKNLRGATTANGPTLMKEISEHLNLFDNYFEQ